MDELTRALRTGIDTDYEKGVVTGYLVHYNVKDSYNTIFQPGSFTKTLSERKKHPVLWCHDPRAVIGSTIQVWEVEDGVMARIKLNLEVQQAKDVYSYVKAGDIEGMSFKFDPIPGKVFYRDGIKVFAEVKLVEVSLTAYNAIPGSQITDVRSILDEALNSIDEHNPEAQEKVETAISTLRALVSVEPSTLDEPDTPDSEPLGTMIRDYLHEYYLAESITNLRSILSGD